MGIATIDRRNSPKSVLSHEVGRCKGIESIDNSSNLAVFQLIENCCRRQVEKSATIDWCRSGCPQPDLVHEDTVICQPEDRLTYVNEVAIVRIQRILLFWAICIHFGVWSGCANRNACNPAPQLPYPQQFPQQQVPQQFPQQQYSQQPYQAYPYPGQQGQPIQPSPNVGVPLSANGSQPGYGVPPTGFVQSQPPVYPGFQPGQPNPYYVPQTGQASKPFFGR